MRVCVYTAIYGNYDKLQIAPRQSVPTDFVCYTDSSTMSSTRPWIVVRDLRLPELHPRLRAKWFKTHPHELFPGGRPAPRQHWRLSAVRLFDRYDSIIWIDGSIQVKSEHFARDLVRCAEGSGIALFRHPDRACIYDEAVESQKWRKYAGLPIAEQVESYRAEGYPAGRGLMACGVIVRRSDVLYLAAINEAWWNENLHWTYQDQLSLPVVLWRFRCENDWINGHLWFNDWFESVPHQLEEGPVASVA